LIVGGRQRGAYEQAAMAGWHAEYLARHKRLPRLDDYLKPVPTAAEKREGGAHRVLGLFHRLARKGSDDGVR
jgi:hypothetical protein